jgi:hypothetical protein
MTITERFGATSESRWDGSGIGTQLSGITATANSHSVTTNAYGASVHVADHLRTHSGGSAYLSPLRPPQVREPGPFVHVKTIKKTCSIWSTRSACTCSPVEFYTRIGEDHPQARLTNKDIVDIRQQYADGIRICALSQTYGMTVITSAHCRRRVWSHCNTALTRAIVNNS